MKITAALMTAALVLLTGCSSGSSTATPAAPTATVTETVTAPATATPSQVAEAEPTATTPASRTLRGTLQVTVNRNPRYPDNCRGFPEEGYDDLRVGQRVVVADGTGAAVAVGRLGACEFWPLESAEQARGLRFSFTVRDVPKVPFLTVQVGSGGRGEVTFSLAELERKKWKVELSL